MRWPTGWRTSRFDSTGQTDQVDQAGKIGQTGQMDQAGKAGQTGQLDQAGKTGPARQSRGKKRAFVIGFVIAAFLAGILAATGMDRFPAVAALTATDVEWASARGYLAADIDKEQSVTQARFLQMVLAVYEVKEPGVVVPKGAENHWASGIYATAQKEGLIDCSCQIKPDETLTTEEAAKFVMLGLNRKASDQIVSLEEVQAWSGSDSKSPLTYAQASTMIRKMHDVIRDKELDKEGGV